MTKTDVQQKIKTAKGRFFSGVYIKKDGSRREFNGKSHYNSELAGGEPNLASDQVAYYDVNAKGWRSFKVDALVELTIGGVTEKFK